jgi:hypothetical protein
VAADIKSESIVADVELVNQFNLNASKLIEMLGAADPIPAHAGETLKEWKVTGALSTEAYTEGEDIPLSKYEKAEVKTYELTLKPYRKATTLQSIQKRGYAAAVDETDAAMLRDIQAGIKKSVVDALATAELSATGTDLKSAAANAWAALMNKAEEYGFGDIQPVFFVNPSDFADMVGKSDTLSAFGLSYIEGAFGLGNMVATAAVPAGTVYAVPQSNLKVYYIDASEGQGFEFYTDESGLIAVQHDATLRNLSYETVAWTALTVFAEYADLIAKGTIAPAA